MIQEKYDPVLGQDIVIQEIDVPKEEQSSVVPRKFLGKKTFVDTKYLAVKKKHLKQKKG